MVKIFDTRVIALIEENARIWLPPDTIPPHERYLELYKPQERLKPIPIEQEIAELRACGVERAVIFGSDLETRYGKKVPNEAIAELVQQHSDFFLGFAGVDPWKGMQAVRDLDYAYHELGLRGVNIGPWLYGLKPNDKRFYPIYTKAVELDIPIVLHTSSHFFRGVSMETGNPVYVDEVAIDFPELKLIASHAGWPWILQMVAVAWRHPNVYLENSAMLATYLHSDLVRYMDTPILADKFMFASDHPLLPIDRAAAAFLELPLKSENMEKMLWKNAERLLLGG